MNRLIAIAPVALLTTACAVRTPATALDAQVAQAAQDPPTRQMEVPSDVDAIAVWQLPTSSPWSRYEKLTLLTYLADAPVTMTMPDIEGLSVVQRARAAAVSLAAAGIPEDTMWIVDLRGAASVVFGATLSHQSTRPVAPVMTFNNWPAENETVPAEQTLAALVSMRPRALPAGEIGATPVFLLDAWRVALRNDEPDPGAMDNRYVLLSSDFPDPAELRARGIKRVVYVVEDRGESSTEEDDVHEQALAYQDAGIEVELCDLQELAGLEPAADPLSARERWAGYHDDWTLHVRARRTIFDDPGFYQRGRGGFGGVRAAPPGRVYTAAMPGLGAEGGAGSGAGGGRAYSGASPHVIGGSGG